MSGGYNPAVAHPRLFAKATISPAFQTPFFFGASQVPNDLHLAESQYNGAKGKGIHNKDKISRTHKGDYDFTTKQGSKVFHRRGHNIKLTNVMPFMK
jgi:hypothetical protein